MRERMNFPTFGWGLSLRLTGVSGSAGGISSFPHLRVGTFIEASHGAELADTSQISPPSGGDFH